MANYSQVSKPTALNLDKSPKYLNPNEGFYLLNHEVNNPAALEKATPLTSNYAACDMELPVGESYNVGKCYSPLTNETYSWTLNSHGVNFISRINGDGECEIVWNGNPSCLPLSADPKHSIEQFRAVLDVDYLCSKVPGGKLKRLIWVDGTDTPIGSLDVEASIATDSFSTPFFDRCQDECAMMQLCVPEPQGCLQGEFIPYVNTDKGLSNSMLNKGFKFMYRYVYYDNRASEWSDRSSLYFQDAKGCFDNSEGFSRCMKFRIPIGNPMVERIEFAFSDDGGYSWFVAESIEKYKQYNSIQQYWYERELSEQVSSTYDPEDCTFEYIFCNDKGRKAVPPSQVSRELNPIPRGAQGVFRTKEAFAFYNYINGTCPIDKNEADKIDVQLNCDTGTQCEVKQAKVTIRAVIYNEFYDKNGFIFRENGGSGVADDTGDPAWFSTTNDAQKLNGDIYGVFTGYGQTFSDKTRNFIAYIEGTSYYGEMEQWRSTPNFNSKSKVGVLSGMGSQSEMKKRNNDIANGNFYYQEYTFIVPRGTKGFVRLVSHSKTNGLGANQNTSTQVIGTTGEGFLTTYKGNQSLFGRIDAFKKEIYFDTCNGDVDSTNAIIIYDFYNTSGIDQANQSSAYSGYITDKNGLPVPGARIYRASTFETTTDYNGFYAFNKIDGTGDSIVIDVYVEKDCTSTWLNIENFSSQSSEGEIANTNYTIESEEYQNKFYAIVKVLVRDCNNNPVGGVRVALSGDKYKITGADGIATFRVRNYVSRARQVTAVVMDKGACFTADCNDSCNPCMPYVTDTLPSCFQEKPTISLTTAPGLNTESIGNNKGLKKGGRYALGWVVEWDCGKLSAVQSIPRNNGYFDIPRLQETKSYNYCSFSFSGNDVKLPAGAKRLKFVRSTNLNPYDLQWVVDSIERTSDGKIKLTFQSLNDYNAQYNFKTNTGYAYSKGDRVEFIKNGDGNIFTTDENGLLNYLILSPYNDQVISGVTDDINYFNQLIISDDGKLDALKEGAVIEIQSPLASVTDLAYFEFCATVPLVQMQNTDGTFYSALSVDSGIFTTFDTYLVSRQIGRFPAQFFEHKSPSDFWGTIAIDNTLSFIDDTGKVHFVNKYENERRYGRNISVNSANQLNYFGDVVKTLEALEQGDIIGIALKGDKLGLAICENSPFLFQISDQLLRVGSDNVIRATTGDSLISNPEVNVIGNFGCQYQDVGSIFFGDGYALYTDTQNQVDVVHNYQYAKIAGTSRADEGGVKTTCDSFFKRRIVEKENANRNSGNFLDHYRFSVGINKSTGVVYKTLKSLRHPGINNASSVYELPNDTIMYDPENDRYAGFSSATPEGYSELNLNSDTGCAMVMFQNSIPFITPVIPESYNTFFGISCDWIVGISINKGEAKIKVPYSYELQSDTMFYVKRVTTDNPNFISEIPPIRVKRNQQGKWNAAFLNNVNSRGGLYNGQNARGYYCSVLFIRDNTINLAYGTIDNNKRQQYSELDEIMFKFSLAEQSAFTENL